LTSELDDRTGSLSSQDLSFAEWARVFGDAKMTTALLERLTHHRHIVETGSDSLGFQASPAPAKLRKEKSSRLTTRQHSGAHP
jgi:hypothetical protein